MLYLYLDESGDLGFDFSGKSPSKYFTITILAVRGSENNRQIAGVVRRTIRKKLNPKNKRNRIVQELKASLTAPPVKEYFLRKLLPIDFKVYSLSLNKARVYDSLTNSKDRLYNFVSRLVLDRIEFSADETEVELIIDRSKGKREIEEFDSYILRQLAGYLDPNRTRLTIRHERSETQAGLQAVDMLSWVIFKHHECGQNKLLDLIKGKIRFDAVYLPHK